MTRCLFLVISLRFLLACGSVAAGALPPYTLTFQAATPEERALLIKSFGAVEANGMRHAERGQFWVYGFPLAAGAHCRFELTLNHPDPDSVPQITVLGADNRPLPARLETESLAGPALVWTVPDNWPLGQKMRVVLSAKRGGFDLQAARLSVTDRDTRFAGVPDVLLQWMTEGLTNARVVVPHNAERASTVTPVPSVPTPDSEPLTDAVLTGDLSPGVLANWKALGYAVWAPQDARLSTSVAPPPQAVQTGEDGKPLVIEGRPIASPTPDQVALERGGIEALLTAGADGLWIESPAYNTRAGYEPSFRQAWQARLGTPWQDPQKSVSAHYEAGRLMAQLVTERVNALLQPAALERPGVARVVGLSSPLQSLMEGVISPAWQIANAPSVQEVVGEVGLDTVLAPARINGVRRSLPFDQAYLGYSALFGAMRDLNKRLWFAIPGPAPQPQESVLQAKDRYEQQVVAALLFGEVGAFEAPPLPVSGVNSPDDLIAEVANVNNVLAQIRSTVREATPGPDDIGVLVSDSAQWQHEPRDGDLDSLYGLTLPLLQRGIPVQLASLERTVDPGYLNHFRTLLLSYDSQKPIGTPTHAALAEWVRRGGSLLFFGGGDPYNGVTSGWWQQAHLSAPQADLWKQLGLDLTGDPTQHVASLNTIGGFQTMIRNGSGARTDSLDLQRYAAQTGSVALRFAAARGATSAAVSSVELRIAGQIAASFIAGSDVESRFLVSDHGSRFGAAGRIVDGENFYTYQFDNLPRNTPIVLQIADSGALEVQVASVQPDFGNTLLTTGAVAGLADLFPRLRIGSAYAATLYPLPPVRTNSRGISGGPVVRPSRTPLDDGALVPLYTLRSGGAPIWMQKIGRGHLFYVGVSPGFFSASARSGGLLRGLTRLAEQRAGGIYRETGTLRIQRGRIQVVRTFASGRLVEGRTVDLFSPTLAVTEDRTVPPHSVALLYDLGPIGAPPHLGFVAGRVQAQVETETSTAFLVRGPRAVRGIARLHRGGKQLAGLRAVNRLGEPVTIQAEADGATLLLRYPNDPAGVAIRVGWR